MFMHLASRATLGKTEQNVPTSSQKGSHSEVRVDVTSVKPATTSASLMPFPPTKERSNWRSRGPVRIPRGPRFRGRSLKKSCWPARTPPIYLLIYIYIYINMDLYMDEDIETEIHAVDLQAQGSCLPERRWTVKRYKARVISISRCEHRDANANPA